MEENNGNYEVGLWVPRGRNSRDSTQTASDDTSSAHVVTRSASATHVVASAQGFVRQDDQF